jgi:hypothetical protein
MVSARNLGKWRFLPVPCWARWANFPQIDVPPDDVARHLTFPTVGNIGLEHRPVVIIHSGAVVPADVFTAVQYHRTWFWIAEDDFDSKLAFTVLQILLALARTENAPGAIVTIPAG